MSNPDTPPDLHVDIPIPGGLKIDAEAIPYRILFVGDLAGSSDGRLSGPLSERAPDVSPDTFGDVFAQACPTVNFTVTDPLVSGNAMAEVNLKFDSLKSFDPRALAGGLDATMPLLEAHEAIVARIRGQVDRKALDTQIASLCSADRSLADLPALLEWTPTATTDPSQSSDVDALLGQLDLGTGAESSDESSPSDDVPLPPPKSLMGQVVSGAAKTAEGAAAAIGATIPAEEISACRRTLAEIDRRISAWITVCLQSPQIRKLETAWRSLYFLLSHMDFRKGLRLSVLHANRDDLLERFGSLVIDPVFDEGATAPDLIVIDQTFGQSASDFEILDELAQHAASLPSVVLADVGSEFFGVKHAFQVPTLPPLVSVMSQWQFAKYRTLQSSSYAYNLALVFGRGLLRVPHSRGDAKEWTFAYSEPAQSANDLIWVGGAAAAACNVARSVATTGWPTAISGLAHGCLDDFPLAEGIGKNDKTLGPTDTKLNESKIQELGAVGINALTVVPGSNEAGLCGGMTVAAIRNSEASSVLQASLPYRLFACRLSALMFALKPHLSHKDVDSVRDMVQSHVATWLSPVDPESTKLVDAKCRESKDQAGTIELAVTVTPPKKLLPGEVPVVLGYRLP